MIPRRGRRGLRFVPDARANIEFGTILLALVGVMAAGAGASFVVDSALEMGQKGSATATDAGGQKGSALLVLEVRGERGATGLMRLREVVAADGAGGTVPLEGLVLYFQVKESRVPFPYSEAPQPGFFTVDPLRDLDASTRQTPPILNEGDLAELVIELGTWGPLLDSVGTYTQEQAAPGIRTTQSTLTVGSGASGNVVRLV